MHFARGLSGVSVVGVGEVKAAPDIARTNVGIEVRAGQADQATAQANQQMAAIVSALKGQGVADADLRTHSLSVNFEREYQPPPQPVIVVESGSGKPKATSSSVATAEAAPAQPQGFYRVSNMVEVTVRDLNRVSQILAAATGAGANQLWGINFEVSDTAPFVAQAREKAVAQAKANAEQLAQLTGVSLGPVVTIADGAGSQSSPLPMMMMAKSAEAAGAVGMPVERGELTVTHQVSVTYALAKEEKHAH